jgi:hypothetical protein
MLKPGAMEIQSPTPAGREGLRSRAPLDLVVPFTTPRLTAAALGAAARLGAGLDSAVRLVKVQVVPFPLDLRFSPVPAEFLEAQLQKMCADQRGTAVTSEIRFAREFEAGLRSTLRFRSMVVLATQKRPWRTRTERLADSMRRAGYTVVMVQEDLEGSGAAASREHKYA